MHSLRTRTMLLAMLLGATPVFAQHPDRYPGLDLAPSTAEQLGQMETELLLAGENLRVVNVYKLQALILHASRGQPAERVVDRLVREVYAPHREFWNGYLGEEANFRRWAATQLLSGDHPIHQRIEPVVLLDLGRQFNEGAAWIEANTGRRPQGTWFLAFGPGWTNMGGLGGTTMVADFTIMEPDADEIGYTIPHELTHQVHGPSPARRDDPDAGTVLERIVSEGFGSYVSFLYGAGRLTPARAINYTEDEWAWALAHEAELLAAARPHLEASDRESLNLLASRSEHLIPGAPAAAGYFIGFRILQAYVAAGGADSWKEIYDLPVREVLVRSGYAPGNGATPR